jgi:hypothetical protein
MIENLTALYSPLDIEYSQAMSGPYEDISYHGEDCTVIAGLKDGCITGFWRPVVAVGDEKALKLQIVRLWEISRQIRYMDFLEGGKLSIVSQFLLRQGYVARPYFTQIIDIRDIAEARKGIRKSYKSLCNKEGRYIPTPEIIHRWGIWTEFKSFHRRCHGCERPDSTWDIQSRMIDAGEAILCVNEWNAGVMFYVRPPSAYYACAAIGAGAHKLIWAGIEYLSKNGVTHLEMGEQVFHGDKKLVNISKFKRGFSGTTQARLILEPK